MNLGQKWVWLNIQRYSDYSSIQLEIQAFLFSGNVLKDVEKLAFKIFHDILTP